MPCSIYVTGKSWSGNSCIHLYKRQLKKTQQIFKSESHLSLLHFAGPKEERQRQKAIIISDEFQHGIHSKMKLEAPLKARMVMVAKMRHMQYGVRRSFKITITHLTFASWNAF